MATSRVHSPVLAGASGAAIIAFSAIFVRLADVTPVTAAVYRCVYALPFLGLLVWYERRAGGLIGRRELRYAGYAGGFFAADLVLWHECIASVGAGLATVLGNTQVVLVGPAAWLLLGERPTGRQLVAMPLALVGVVLISGLVGAGAYGDNPVRGAITGVGTGIAYTGFLLYLRQATPNAARPVTPLAVATAVAAIVTLAYGMLTGSFDAVPHLPAHAWLLLLAVSCQVVAWLLIVRSLSLLPAIVTSIILTIQPLGSLLLGAMILSERPSGIQLAGSALILLAMALATLRPGARPRPHAATT